MSIQKNKNIWRSGLTEEEKYEAEKKLREWINSLNKED